MSTDAPHLLRLPNELLFSIFSSPALNQPDLYHVAQSCRQLSEAALEILYSKDVTISWRIIASVRSGKTPKETRIIHTLLAFAPPFPASKTPLRPDTRHPERGHSIKRLHITDIPLYYEPLRCAYQRRLFARAAAAGVFHNVQHLSLDQIESDEWHPLSEDRQEEEDPVWGAEPTPDFESTEKEIYALGFASLGTFPLLEKLEVRRSNTSFDIEVDNSPLAKFVAAHPGLKKLKLDFAGLLDPFVEILDSTSTWIEELWIECRADADYELVRELVLKFPRLQSFHFDDLDHYGGQCNMQQWTDILTNLSTATNKGLQRLEIGMPIARERLYTTKLREQLVDQFPNLENLNFLRFTSYFRQSPKFWAVSLRGHPKLRFLNIPDSFCRRGDKPTPEEMAERLRIFWDELPQLEELTCWIGKDYPRQHYMKVRKEVDEMKWKELDELAEDDQ